MKALKPILYYSIFNHPLTKEEIFLYSQSQNRALIENEIKVLQKIESLKEHNGFYIYNNDFKIAERRLASNRNAKLIMPKALKRAHFISKFPYVKSVSISGALSKGAYDDEGDIDFFIITTPNRLWVARTSLILYKKIFLLNSKKYFCVNYFISTNHLEISEQNLFTATELATLIPVTGKKTYTDFLANNTWVKKHFPNMNFRKVDNIKDVKPFMVSKLLEAVFNSSLGNFVDHYCRKMTLKRWTSKFSNLEKEQFEIALKSTKSVSKHHPQNFQKKVIEAYEQKCQEFEAKHNIKCN
ncbi:hypothetical protein [Lacinutrix sp. Hel_I_90]|uniref:hypothetical protein n=1 Tax=Lacinutrix sp. Hel_I_90 TaxID=1249999 RepID=UPI0005C95CE7|nr:hypothetical protein [Lacinutrix sp. Hel_I_90]